ncbi:MAG: class I adenylate-forming enzyme family protein [Hyphomonadaceae bacterium]
MSADGANKFPALTLAETDALLTRPGSPFEVAEAEVRGVRMKIWKNAPPTLREIFAASAAFKDRDALVYNEERVTYAGYRAAAFKLAAQLSQDGVKKGDRVALVMRNLPEWPVAFWAAVLIGAIVTPLNAWWTGPELEYGLTDSGAKILIADDERWERLREHVEACPALEKIYVSRLTEEPAHPLVTPLEAVIGAPSAYNAIPEGPPPSGPLGADDDAAIFYTSGTTGRPKGAIITHRNIVSNVFNAAYVPTRALVRRGETPPAPGEGPLKVILLSVPFFHATGAFAIMIPCMLSGPTIIMQRRFDVDAALPIIERERVTSIGGVPTIAWQFLEHPKFKDYDLSSLELVTYGGAPGSPELVRRINEKMPQAMPGHGWGMTETSASATGAIGEDYMRKPSSCGLPPPTGESKIVGPKGETLPLGEVGELWYKGPVVVRGYWGKPEATAETFFDGWVKTGDLARKDDEGFLYIVDRAKDMLIRGGENIYCIEVENALYTHPAVMDAAVIGIPHKTLGEEPAAVVHLKPGMKATEAELRTHVADQIASFKVPVRIVFLPETLPRNANGKIIKRDLKGVFTEQKS